MILFDLLCDLKKVQSMEHINQPIHISNKTLGRHVNHLDIPSLGPPDVLDILGLIHSNVIGKISPRNPKSFSQACLPWTKD